MSEFNKTENVTVVATDSTESIERVLLAILVSVVIVITVIGNTLVILAVLTTRRLRTVTNCFVMSLAVADWLVGIFVMPPAVAYRLMDGWMMGNLLCDIWVYLDILLCTASILSLCAISVDRYLAVTQPLSYSRKRRSKRLACSMILVVWISSALITCPPMFGWPGRETHSEKDCSYNRNKGYVIFSAMGSFFIPMAVMLYVYIRISCVVAQRHDQLSNIDRGTTKSQRLVLSTNEEFEMDQGSSECEDQVRFTKYAAEPVNACVNSTTVDPNLASNHVPELRKGTRSLRTTNLSYTYSEQPLSKARATSLYTASTLRPPPHVGGGAETLKHLDVSVLNFEPASRVSSFRRETKTAQTLSIVVGGFIVCWLPFFVYYLITPALEHNDATKVIMGYLTWLGWINSAMNPFIYAFYSPDFRIAFWRLTFKRFTTNRRADLALQHK